jgi:ankyrin repeat protein
MEHEVGDKTVTDVFGTGDLAELAKAACTGNVATVQNLIGRGVKTDQSGLDGVTPLIWTLNCESLPGLEALLKAGADPNHRIRNGDTPVLLAATYSNPKVLQLLLKHGGNPDAQDGVETALRVAFATGFDRDMWDNYYTLLDAGADINKADEVGNTVATYALALGRPSKVLELLDRGYNNDLPRLAIDVCSMKIGKEFPEFEQKHKLIERLESMGIDFAAITEERGSVDPATGKMSCD